MRSVQYNSQRDNYTVGGVNGYSQCFSTSAVMLLSYLAPNVYKADDATIKQYITDLTVGNMFEWSRQAAMIQRYLDKAGAPYTVKLGIDLTHDTGLLTPEDLREKLAFAPVIVGTKKMAGLPGGHIILAIDNTPDGKYCVNDPYGDANTGYKDANGAGVIYHSGLFDPEHPGAKIRAIYTEAKK